MSPKPPSPSLSKWASAFLILQMFMAPGTLKKCWAKQLAIITTSPSQQNSGNQFDETTKQITGKGHDRAYIRSAVEASLRRLKRDAIDLYQLHIDDLDGEDAVETQSALEELVKEGKIKAYGWSSDFPKHSSQWVGGENFKAIQHDLNLFIPANETLKIVNDNNLISLNRAPLAMGMLGGAYKINHAFGEDDVRSAGFGWLDKMGNLKSAEDAQARLDGIKELLQTGGRTTAQGALGWIWAHNDRALPIPGFPHSCPSQRERGRARNLAHWMWKHSLKSTALSKVKSFNSSSKRLNC